MTDNTSKNIRALRNAYGETQLELAFAIGLDSPSTISQYENGTRTPQTRERQRLAEHFRITEDELAHGDFSHFALKSLSADVREIAAEYLDGLLPIISTEKAMQDPLFKKGYEAHMRIIEGIKAGIPADESDGVICVEAYAEAFYDNHICEAAANLLWLFVLAGIGVNFWDWEAFEEAKDPFPKMQSVEEVIKYWFLRNCDDEFEEQRRKARDEFRKESGETYIDLLKELKAYPHLSELADYYSAIMYSYGMINNGLTPEMNQTVGYEMLRAAARLGNRYAKRALKTLRKL